ncbi:hypothetical protein BJ742DRAFT_783766 [Cladochytrium replicatum]|nr:hypothetical protein BJ742DRAFT_783766 [Cladochytrium replicatum]
MVFQVLCILVAIINYVLLTNSIQLNDRRLIRALDIGLASVFLFANVLGFYIAEDKLRFYFNFGSLIDVFHRWFISLSRTPQRTFGSCVSAHPESIKSPSNVSFALILRE